MRPLLLAAIGAALGACASMGSPILIHDADHRAKMTPSEEEQAARDAIRDIEDRVSRGDLPKIQFEFDKSDITPESFKTLDLIAAVLIANQQVKVMVLAHTDAIGTDEYNQALSQRRAEAVKSYLAAQGVHPPSMRSHGYGATRPIADNATDEGRAKNRRVEFKITTRDWSSVY